MSKEAQLESVARDWCMTIRASQVIPVYPLTEDLQPGDVFLVQVPIDKQQAVYKQKGFLPLDNHVGRLEVEGYPAFYKHSFFARAPKTDLPVDWTRPMTGADWALAPGAAFPTYSFSVRRNGGLNLAVPISGVPVGMSLMGSDSADGSVSIENAKTMGLDEMSLLAQLKTWAAGHTADLAAFGSEPGAPPRNYLRVVTRVYSTGKMSVLLNDAKTAAGGADVGVPRPVDLVQAKTPTGPGDVQKATLDNYADQLAKLNAMIAESTDPGNVSAPAGKAVDAETQKTLDLKKQYVDAAKSDVAAKTAALKTAETASAADLNALATEQSKLASLRSQLLAARDEANRKAIQDQIAATSTDVDTATNKVRGVLDMRSALNDAKKVLGTATSMLPGGSLRVTAASSRSISMQQTFDPPLIIGYLGFDVPILYGGKLGSLIPTSAALDKGFGVDLSAHPNVKASTYNDEFEGGLYGLVVGNPKSAAKSEFDALSRFMPPAVPIFLPGGDSTLSQYPAQVMGGNTFAEYMQACSARRDSLTALNKYLSDPPKAFKLQRKNAKKENDGDPVEIKPDSDEWKSLVRTRDALARPSDPGEVLARRQAVAHALQELSSPTE